MKNVTYYASVYFQGSERGPDWYHQFEMTVSSEATGSSIITACRLDARDKIKEATKNYHLKVMLYNTRLVLPEDYTEGLICPKCHKVHKKTPRMVRQIQLNYFKGTYTCACHHRIKLDENQG